MADEINIKFGGDSGELETALKRVTGEIGKLNTQVEKTGDEIQDTFSAESRRAIDQMRARTNALRQSITKLKNEEVKAIKQSTSFLTVLAKLRAASGIARESFRQAYQAVAMFVGGIHDAITSADEFIEELDAIQNPLFEFSQATSDSIEKVNAKLNTMTGLSKALKVQLAEEFTPIVGTVTDAINNLSLVYGKVNKKVLELTQGQLGLGFVISDFLSGGSLTKLKNAAEAVNVVFGFQQEELTDLEGEFASFDDQLVETTEKLTGTSDVLEKSLAKLAAIEFRADQKSLEGVEKISAAYAKQFLQVYNVQQALKDLHLTEEQRGQAAQKVFDTIEALHEAEAAEKQKVIDKDEAARQKSVENIIKQEAAKSLAIIETKEAGLAEERAAAAKHEEELTALRMTTASAVGDAFGMTSDIINDMLRNSEGKSKKQMRTLFGLQKAAAIGQATIAGVQASMLALATPPGPPFTFPLAATVGAMAAANVAVIAAQEAPFHVGSRVSDLASDEMRITRREGLAVLTPQGIQSGGAEAVANANAGMAPAASSQPLVFQYQHQMFDATIEDNIKRSNSPLGAVLRSSSYGHRRRNG